MKSGYTILFMLAIFCMMGAIGYAIPEDGLHIGDTTLEFPTIEKMVKPDTPKIDNSQAFIDAENMRQFIAASRLSEQMQRRREVLRHRYAINYPDDSIEWIFPVFEALNRADTKKVRILHYGDSQIEIDRITSDLRERMQNLFGGYGVGLIPAIQTVPTTAINQNCNRELTRYLVFGSQEMRMPEELGRDYGIMGQTATIDGTATFSFKTLNLRQTKRHTKKFGSITLLTDHVTEPLTVQLSHNNTVTHHTIAPGCKHTTFQLPDSTTNLAVTINGRCLIHGFMLDGNGAGVQYDNAAMRGCSGTIFTSISAESMQNYFDRYTVPLIILQYGGNVVPYVKNQQQIDSYCASLKRQIDWLKRLSPASRLLFIGPTDMSTNIGGKMVSYPMLKDLTNTLRAMCNANDVAYWDVYRAMGGENSMASWVTATPPLAGADYVHFTPAGATKTADMLFEAIDVARKYYEWQLSEEE